MEASGNSLLCKSTYVFLYGREYLPLMGYLCTLSLSNTCNIILKMFWSKNISFWNFWEIFQMKTLIPHENWNPALSGVFFLQELKASASYFFFFKAINGNLLVFNFFRKLIDFSLKLKYRFFVTGFFLFSLFLQRKRT